MLRLLLFGDLINKEVLWL